MTTANIHYTSTHNTKIHDIVIIGAGPAGLTAAIYAARANLYPLVLEGEAGFGSDQPGGQLMLTTDVENYPAFPNGVLGPDLMAKFRTQALKFGATINTVKASKVDFSTSPHKIWTENDAENSAENNTEAYAEDNTETHTESNSAGSNTAGSNTEAQKSETPPTYLSHAVIIATGARSLMLQLDREIDFIGSGLSTCATCDGFFFREREIAVVGGGDSAMEEALFLTRFASKVTVIHRRDELRASKIMQERALNNNKIRFIWNTVVEQYLGETSLSGLKLRNVLTGEVSLLKVAGCFVAIGHKPNTDLFKGQLQMKDNGYLVTQPGSTKTSIAGIFACGDVQDDHYRQAITAAGSGCQAAMDAESYIETKLH